MTTPRPKAPPLPAQRSLDNAVRRLQAYGQAEMPTLDTLAHIAIVAAADTRDAMVDYDPAYKSTAQAEREYRKLQAKAGFVLTWMRDQDTDTTPDAEWSPFPAGLQFGELKTAGGRELAINALCADARFERDMAASRQKAAELAMKAMLAIISLMQTLTRSGEQANKLGMEPGHLSPPEDY